MNSIHPDELLRIKGIMNQNMDKEEINKTIQKLIQIRDNIDVTASGKYFDLDLTPEQLKAVTEKNDALKEDVKQSLVAIGISDAISVPVEISPVEPIKENS